MSVRRMVPDDALGVARLYAARFRAGREVDLQVVAQRLVRAYFEHPWPDPEIGSWVFEVDGEVIGFLGVAPRPWVWGERRLRVAVIGNLLVDDKHPHAGASHQIIKAYLSEPWDFSISDHALEVTRKTSDRFGGATVRLLSQRWSLQLKPAALAVNRRFRHWFGPEGRLASLGGIARPTAHFIDAFGQTLQRGPYRVVQPDDCTVQPMTIERFAKLLAERNDPQPHPVYDAERLAWLLATPPGRDGTLRLREVKNPAGHSLGWFAQYVEEDAELLHFTAELGAGERVFACVIADAIRCEARALTGRIIPSVMREMSMRGVRFHTDDYFILYPRSPEIRHAFHAGEVSVGPMDGEGWTMRFVDVSMDPR